MDVPYELCIFDTRPKYSRRRCPYCNATSHRLNKYLRECRNGHMFHDPTTRYILENGPRYDKNGKFINPWEWRPIIIKLI